MNSTTELFLFNSLLQQVSLKFRETNTVQSVIIKEWKGQDIINFQDDLRSKTGSSISEKWFYTYVKNEPEKLPRIDILNMLSQYVGSDSWNAFAKANQKEQKSSKGISKKNLSEKEFFMKLLKSLLIITTIGFSFYIYNSKDYEYNYCLKDFYRKTAITDIPINVYVLNDKQHRLLNIDKNGCFKGSSSSKENTFIIESPYYKNDTITLHLDKILYHDIYLKPDDYALMLDYYSNGNITDFKNRRKQLDQLLHKDIIIMELLPYEIGVTIYDKQQFIDKLTTPTQNLKKLEIVTTEYNGEQIKKLKFRIKS